MEGFQGFRLFRICCMRVFLKLMTPLKLFCGWLDVLYSPRSFTLPRCLLFFRIYVQKQSVRIIVHPEAIGSSAWRAHGCDAQLYGSSALFFVKFWWLAIAFRHAGQIDCLAKQPSFFYVVSIPGKWFWYYNNTWGVTIDFHAQVRQQHVPFGEWRQHGPVAPGFDTSCSFFIRKQK